jgi:hypothetical protein
MDEELLEEWPLVDVFDSYARHPTEQLLINSMLRFDFNKQKAGPGHPAAHLTINGQD